VSARRISLRFATNFVISRKVGTHALEYRRCYRYSRRNSSALLSLTIPEQAGIVSQPYEKFIYEEGTRYLGTARILETEELIYRNFVFFSI